MATRAYIHLKDKDGKVKTIYNHCDGDQVLHQHLVERYADYKSVKALIAEGDCSFPGQPYNDGPSTIAITHLSMEEFLKFYNGCPKYFYHHLFDAEKNVWYFDREVLIYLK